MHAPTIAGHGKNADKHVTDAEGVTSLVDYLTSRDLRDVVLVGHSFGGTFIAKAAEQVPGGWYSRTPSCSTMAAQ